MKDLEILETNKTDTEKKQEKYNEIMFNKMEVEIAFLSDQVRMLNKERFNMFNFIVQQDKQIKRVSLAQIFLTIVLFLQLIYLAIWLKS